MAVFASVLTFSFTASTGSGAGRFVEVGLVRLGRKGVDGYLHAGPNLNLNLDLDLSVMSGLFGEKVYR